MVDVADLFQSVLIGSLYALMALGLTLTYAVAKIPNFAHAEYVTVGAYTAAFVTIAFVGAITLGGSGAAAAIVAAFALAFVVAAAIALLSDELVFRPLFRRAATSLHLLVASIGVGLIIRYALSLLVAPYDFLVVTPRIGKDLIRLPGGEALAVAGAPVTNLLAGAIPTTFGIVAALHLLLTRTRIGKGMRAMASNFDLARVAGIKTTNVRRFTWLLAGALAGVGGAFWVIDVPGTPEMGWGILLWMFAASILGGFTSFGIYLIVALSFSLEYGYAGQPNVGNVCFYSIGAYVAGALTTHVLWALAGSPAGVPFMQGQGAVVRVAFARSNPGAILGLFG